MADETKETEETTAADETAGGEEPAATAETAAAEIPDEARAAAEEPATDEQPAAAESAEAPAAEEPVEAAAEESEASTEDTTDDAAAAAADEEPAAEGAAAAEPATGEEHTYEELKGMTVVRMREIAEAAGDHDALHGYTTMHKEELLVALCTALGIEAHEHHEVVGIDKSEVKSKIRALKQQREALIEAKDARQLKIVRRRIRSLKRKIHKATV